MARQRHAADVHAAAGGRVRAGFATDMSSVVAQAARHVPFVMPGKQRAHAVVLRQWLLSPEHFTHPYPTRDEEEELMRVTGLERKQLKNWFVNMRKRLWKPLMAKCGARFTPSGVLLPPTAVPVPVAPATPQFTSRFRGVCAERNKWRAQITIAGKKQFLGTFETQRQAAAAYDRAALRYHGAKAVTNFPSSAGRQAGVSSPSTEDMDHDSDSALSVGSVPSAATCSSGRLVLPHGTPPVRSRAAARPRGGSDETARVRKPKRARPRDDTGSVGLFDTMSRVVSPPAKRPALQVARPGVYGAFANPGPSGGTSPVPITAVRLPLHLRRKNKARKLRTMVAMDAAARQALAATSASLARSVASNVGATPAGAGVMVTEAVGHGHAGATTAPPAPQPNFLLTLCDAALQLQP